MSDEKKPIKKAEMPPIPIKAEDQATMDRLKRFAKRYRSGTWISSKKRT